MSPGIGIPTALVFAVAALAVATFPSQHASNAVTCDSAETNEQRIECLRTKATELESRSLPDAGDSTAIDRIHDTGKKHQEKATEARKSRTAQLNRQPAGYYQYPAAVQRHLTTRQAVWRPESASSNPHMIRTMSTVQSVWPGSWFRSSPSSNDSSEVSKPTPLPSGQPAGAAGSSRNPSVDNATQVPDITDATPANPDPDRLGPTMSVAPVERIGQTGAIAIPVPEKTPDGVETATEKTIIVVPGLPATGLIPTARPGLRELDPDMRDLPSLSETRKRTMAPVIRRASAYQLAINAALSKACGPGVLSPENSFVSTIAAQIYQESNYLPKAQSAVGAQGLTQMMPDTAAGLAKQYAGLRPPRPWDPFWSIEAQAHLMCDNYRLYQKNRSPCSAGLFALSAYNGGPRALSREMDLCRGRTPEWLAQPAIRQTRPITDNSCVTTRWFDHVGDMRSRSVAAYKENREYIDRILSHQLYFMEAGWGGGWCHVSPYR